MQNEQSSDNVKVWVEGSLRKKNLNAQPFSFPAGKTVYAIMIELGISSSQPVVALVNGTSIDINEKLNPGDQVRLLPVISGG